jgi:hypothetical protein
MDAAPGARAMIMRRLAALLLLILVAGCGGSRSSQIASSPGASVSGTTLASGELRLPAAQAFGEPGFHAVLTATARLPAMLPSSPRLGLVLELRDVGRPGQTCSQEHPLSGCATVDWADDPGRPNVPPSGVFRNALTVRLASGTRTLFLHESGSLTGMPESFRLG